MRILVGGVASPGNPRKQKSGVPLKKLGRGQLGQFFKTIDRRALDAGGRDVKMGSEIGLERFWAPLSSTQMVNPG